MSDIDQVFTYFFGSGTESTRRELLSLDPDRAADAAYSDLKLSINRGETILVARTIAALVRVTTAEQGRRRAASSARVTSTMRAMHRVHLLALALAGLMFLVGVGFIVVAVWLAWEGRLDSALVAGTVGVLDVALGLLAKPQREVIRSAQDQLQIRLAFNSFIASIDQIGANYEWQSSIESLPTKAAIAAMIHGSATTAVSDIEEFAIPHDSRKPKE